MVSSPLRPLWVRPASALGSPIRRAAKPDRVVPHHPKRDGSSAELRSPSLLRAWKNCRHCFACGQLGNSLELLGRIGFTPACSRLVAVSVSVCVPLRYLLLRAFFSSYHFKVLTYIFFVIFFFFLLVAWSLLVVVLPCFLGIVHPSPLSLLCRSVLYYRHDVVARIFQDGSGTWMRCGWLFRDVGGGRRLSGGQLGSW
jgi:hypothetical protein